MAAKKRAPKRPKQAAKAPRRGHQNIPLVDIRKVDITWCSRDGTLKQISVNIEKVAGFLWRYDPDQPMRDVINPDTEPVPHTGRVVVVRGDCKPKFKSLSVPVGCWWDGSRWVCPVEPA
jgi:hypothetical protein